ncbi:MAG: PD-(D/E)XK nuclease family protein [Pseudomonadota bacterium]
MKNLENLNSLVDKHTFNSARELPHLSKSMLNTFLICPKKYYLYYELKLNPEFVPESLVFGSAIHRAVAELYLNLKEKGEKLPKEELM